MENQDKPLEASIRRIAREEISAHSAKIDREIEAMFAEAGARRDLRAANIGGVEKGWAVINANGPHGDEIVAGYLTESDARICLAALGGFNGSDDWKLLSTDGGLVAYSAELNQYRPVSRVPEDKDGPHA
jgi:hypothetical protein